MTGTISYKGKNYAANSQMPCAAKREQEVHEPHVWNSEVMRYGPYFCEGFLALSMAKKPVCMRCKKVRTDEPDYSPFALIEDSPDPGWFSGDGEEYCGPCIVALYKESNHL